MYLTRMYLNPRRRQTIRFQRDPESLHAAVESAFPPGAPGAGDARKLWRLDLEGNQAKLLILSARVPSLEHLQEQAGWATEQTWESREYEPLLARITKGQRYAFRLAANPVHTVTGDDGVKRRLAHVSVGHQLRWLEERAEAIGVSFGVADSEGTDPDPTSAVRVSFRETVRFRRGEQRVTLARTRFDGMLEVENAERLRTALISGIGRGKAYGCGLLTLAPLRRPGE